MESLSLHRGYSLIELLIVLAIIGLVTVLAMTNQGDFNKSLTLSNTAYDVALTIRSVEQMGIGTRAVGALVNAPYGLHFPVNSGSFNTFADTSGGNSCVNALPTCLQGDGKYTAGSDTLLSTLMLGNGFKISAICVSDNWAGASRCSSTGDLSNAIDVEFLRPNLATIIHGYDGSGNYIAAAFANACLKITSPQGVSRFIKIGPSGLVLANAASCP